MNLRIHLVVTLVIAVIPLTTAAQTGSLSRHYDPVIIKGGVIPGDALHVAEWRAYAFDATTQTWALIPFQIDEVDGDGEYLKEEDGLLDANDELVFMPGDAGDRAPTSAWLVAAGVDARQRIELAVSAPNKTAEMAWIYLYRHAADPPGVPGYIKYRPSSELAGADTIQTPAYKLGHNRRGWTDFLALSLNRGKDLLDRVKFHISAIPELIGVPPITLTEDTLSLSTETFYPGPVRAFQLTRARVRIVIPPFITIDQNDTFVMPYFPYSTRIGAGFTIGDVSPGVMALLALKHIRLSLDLAPDVSSMKFYSSSDQTGAPIDGTPDAVQTHVDDLTALNWVMASGDDGTLIAFFRFPALQGALGTNIYFRDDASGGTNEGTPDTGDGASYGDMGVWAAGNVLLPAGDSLFVAFTTYYIGEPNKTAAFAEKLKDAIEHPLTATARVQMQEPSSVARQGEEVEDYVLEAFPNPFRPDRDRFIFRMRLPAGVKDVRLRVFNFLGQEVVRFDLDDGTPREAIWDGIDATGMRVAPGLYFYRLEAGQMRIGGKIVVVW